MAVGLLLGCPHLCAPARTGRGFKASKCAQGCHGEARGGSSVAMQGWGCWHVGQEALTG